MAITISGSGITSANIADGTITTDDILASDVKNLKSGRKNLIINGDMRISQRGDYSVTPKSVANNNPTYVLDRWLTYGSGTYVNASQGTVTLPNGTHAYTFKTEAVSAGGSWLHPYQKIEWDRSYRGKTITLSAWVKTNLAGQGMRVCDGATCTVSGSVPSDETWNYVSATFTLQSGDPAHIQVHPAFGGSSVVGSYIEFTHMQVELGSVATDFEYRSYGEELALCQRYYVNAGFGGNDGGVVSAGRDEQYLHVRVAPTRFPVTMRTTPTVAIQSSSTNCMDRYGRGQETCYPVAEGVSPDGFQGVVKKDSGGSSANWTDSGLYINRAGYKAEAEL
jgi:hypothetical protein